MLSNLTGWHAVIILAVILLLFGAAKLPALAKSVGQSMKIFKNEVKTGRDDEAEPSTVRADSSARETSARVYPTEVDPKP
jgi:sec-independent protein translocase protein TatA